MDVDHTYNAVPDLLHLEFSSDDRSGSSMMSDDDSVWCVIAVLMVKFRTSTEEHWAVVLF